MQEKISASADIPIFLLGLKEVPNDQIDGVHDEDVPVSIGAVRGEDAEHGGRPTVGRPFRLEIKITGLTEGAPYVILINMHLGASKDRRSKHVLVAEGYRGIVRFVLPAPSTAAGYAIFVRCPCLGLCVSYTVHIGHACVQSAQCISNLSCLWTAVQCTRMIRRLHEPIPDLSFVGMYFLTGCTWRGV